MISKTGTYSEPSRTFKMKLSWFWIRLKSFFPKGVLFGKDFKSELNCFQYKEILKDKHLEEYLYLFVNNANFKLPFHPFNYSWTPLSQASMGPTKKFEIINVWDSEKNPKILIFQRLKDGVKLTRGKWFKRNRREKF